MPSIVENRFVRLMPGRIRIEVYGLLQNTNMAHKLMQSFTAASGVTKVDPCPLTGRMLLLYDERKISSSDIFRMIFAAEQPESECGPDTANTFCEERPETELARKEAAAASELGISVAQSGEDRGLIVSNNHLASISTLPETIYPPASPKKSVPLPLVVALGGLALLGAKRLLFGKSALAGSAVPFYFAGLVAVVTGYPFLSRGIARFGSEKQVNTDLILGSSALALALIRENVVVLAGISIIQYINWKRTQFALSEVQAVALPPEIRDYSNKAGKLGMAAAAAVWAVTRDPLRGLAVLLAANPRPATIPAEFAWKQAEVEFKEHGMDIPNNGSLSRFARTKTLLLEDTSLLMETNVYETRCASQNEEPEKIICTVASLMEKIEHPWKEGVRHSAKRTCRTLRTAFHVEQEDGGVRGTINNTLYSVGTLSYCGRAGIAYESYYLEAKRLQKQGFEVLFVAKQTDNGTICLGFIYRQLENLTLDTKQRLQRLYEQGLTVAPLRDSAWADSKQISGLSMDTAWLGANEGDILERISILRQQGEEVLLITGQEPHETSRYLTETGVSSVGYEQLESILIALKGVRKIESKVNKHFQITKKWNLIGPVLASLGMMSAPLINLAADAISLIFMAKSQKTAAAAFAGNAPIISNEVAATAEALNWHAEPWENIKQKFNVNERVGLSSEQLLVSQSLFGPNQLEKKKIIPWIVSYLRQFKEFTMLVLVGTAVLAFFNGGALEGLAMGAVLLANAAMGSYQERKAERVIQNLNQFQPPETSVIRNGEQMRISATELVPGDIVHLEAGDRVPADLRIISSSNLEVNEAALTGESVPVEKNEVTVTEDCPLSERNNLLFMGSDVSRGKALAVVIQTGMDTEIGHLIRLLKEENKELTPLQEKVTSISKRFVKWALLAGGVIFITGALRGLAMKELITTAITLAVSAIPEGLPVTVTIALSAGIIQMERKRVVVRKLSALETLGRTTVICTDKTGTLTKNEMTVKEIASVEHRWTVKGNGYEPIGSIEMDGGCEGAPDNMEDQPDLQKELQRIIQIAVLCNNSKLHMKEDKWKIQGDPTEGALLSMAAKAGLGPEHFAHWHRCDEIPFDSNTARMSVVCKDTATGQDCYFLSKGSVESILLHCSSYQLNGEVFPLTDEIRDKIMKQNEKLAGDALRVLGLACFPIDPNEDRPSGIDIDHMIYIGMVGMIDPPKEDLEKIIRQAYSLGVKTVMITGDHPITAIAIAKQIGIFDGNKVLSGYELDRLTDEELDSVVENVSIFARMTPENKLRIVKSLQRQGQIVAMTGDGVNDTPAIKQANIGIAMGLTGTEVAKETADMVLQDDLFSSIMDGVKEGRTIIGNLRRALGCLLSGNLAEILVISGAVFVGMPLPLVPIQILLMNLLTDALPAMVLAANPGNKTKETRRVDIVDKQLYRKIVTRGAVLGMGSIALFASALASGAPVRVARSVAFATLIAGKLIQTFSWRREDSNETVVDLRKDRFMLGTIGISALALLTTLYVPQVARWFKTAPLTLRHWVPILLVGASVSMISKAILAVLSGKQPLDNADQSANPPYSAA
ncbi:HAD-IC family P-type ATPase [Paenibacillus sp. GP183]|uniref:cation-translocating P-type ATPase n=1 Tax=Paenibacillus sp. GP183 TaxID=1882751 RepID=UPI000898C829|nr:HAD-IC family P-type ATPase [Paenibacillus sp. GP183]SEB62758.1 potassium and/or sodium efflux P-type ATPase [Paenibacillus sp. GP183]